MKYRALKRGLKLVETPIVFVDRRVGQSKMSRAIFAEALTEGVGAAVRPVGG